MKVLLVDHYDSYTYNLAHLIADVTGGLPEVVQHDTITTSEIGGGDFSHIVLSPGPGRPHDTEDFSLGSEVFSLGLPVLGVCLGMQALVVAFGGAVERTDPAHGVVSEVAHDSTGAFVGVPSPFKVVRYHSLAATSVGDELVVNARVGRDARHEGAVMGVRHRRLPLWGVQFHPESILSEYGRTVVSNFVELS